MSMALLRNRELRVTLEELDRYTADQYFRRKCDYCDGVLHRGNYSRRCRDVVGDGSPTETVRYSLCCSRCRKRFMPPSVRFLGRKTYLSVVVALVAAMAHGLTGSRVAKLREEIGVDRRTLERWRVWWRTALPQAPFWKGFRGRLMPPVETAALPQSLWERWAQTADGLTALLTSLGPIMVPRRGVPGVRIVAGI